MSGVIIDGIQWEHCNLCGLFERIDVMGYVGVRDSEGKVEKFDTCEKCMDIFDSCEDAIPGSGSVALMHIKEAVKTSWHESRERTLTSVRNGWEKV